MYLLKAGHGSLIFHRDFQKLQNLKVFTFPILKILSLLNDYRNLLLHYIHLVYHSFPNLLNRFRFVQVRLQDVLVLMQEEYEAHLKYLFTVKVNLLGKLLLLLINQLILVLF